MSRDATHGARLTVRGNTELGRDVYIKGWLNARNIRGAGKGLYATEEKLNEAYPTPHNGWFAFVGDTLPADIYVAWGGVWTATGKQGGEAVLEDGKYTELYNDLQDEITARVEAEATETEARTEADAALQAAIDAEAAARKAGDTALQENITAEATARKEAEATLQKGIDTLQKQIDGTHPTIDITEIDSIPASVADAVTMAKDTLHTRYTVTAAYRDSGSTKLAVGVLDVMSDNMGHGLTEVLSTHYMFTANADGETYTLDASGHDDTTVRQMWRSYVIQGGTTGVAAGKWTAWRLMNNDIVARLVELNVAEATARTKADTAIQAAIDTESTAREKADEELREKIASLYASAIVAFDGFYSAQQDSERSVDDELASDVDCEYYYNEGWQASETAAPFAACADGVYYMRGGGMKAQRYSRLIEEAYYVDRSAARLYVSDGKLLISALQGIVSISDDEIREIVNGYK